MHDDLADCLAFAMLPYSPRGSRRIVCGLAPLADPRRAHADADPDGTAVRVVETRAGLVLPRRPAWQSVSGREVSMPASRPVVVRAAAGSGVEALRQRVWARVDGVSDVDPRRDNER